MRSLSLLAIVFLPSLVIAQPPDSATRKRETIDWLLKVQNPDGGFYNVPRHPKDETRQESSLRATSAAVRTIKYLGAELPNNEKHAAFILKCYNPETGGFAEPAGKPDVALTSVGVMAAAALDIPHEKYAKAMTYLKENAKTFEEVRIGAAAVEAWGVKECPFKLDDWMTTANKLVEELGTQKFSAERLQDGLARDFGSCLAFFLRLSEDKSTVYLTDSSIGMIQKGQRKDGGWSKQGEESSDIESTYRVMRALMLSKAKPKDMDAVDTFVYKHRNKDGGFAVKPGQDSSTSGAYYATMILMWLDELEKPEGKP